MYIWKDQLVDSNQVNGKKPEAGEQQGCGNRRGEGEGGEDG